MFKNKLIHHPASAIVIAGFVALTLSETAVSPTAAQAIDIGGVRVFSPLEPTKRDYRECVTDLTRLNVAPETADSTCAKAFKPEDFSRCVVRISRNDAVPATEAVNACRQVRRPIDLASCFTDIRNLLKDTSASEVLSSCQRSILPVRYANCVVGLSQAEKSLTGSAALNTCIDASDFPTEFEPTFIPFERTTPGAIQPDSQLNLPSPSTTPLFPSQTTPTPTTPPSQPVPALY